MHDRFAAWARKSAAAMGSPWAMLVTLVALALFLALGPLVAWSDTYQLVGNLALSIITLVLALLIQASVNHDTAALHKKLDELLRAHQDARSDLVNLEHRPQHEVDEREHEFAVVRDQQTESH